MAELDIKLPQKLIDSLEQIKKKGEWLCYHLIKKDLK
jgi:hypothetical protein